ncbi:MAG: DUF2470 domain-containing protein, partial [Planctomycetota bacterium]|nr:DUF2470 domain-containing protein [Planctomycetota bacterium]
RFEVDVTESVEVPEQSPAELARSWLLGSKDATLGTLSVDEHTVGWPFLSVVPYALAPDGMPFILTAGIAQHTRNMKGDPRASLMVQERKAEGDPQSGWRLTLLGRMKQVRVEKKDGEKAEGDYHWVSSEAYDELNARYRERVPQARSYMATHGFQFWILALERVRFIAGFGRIHWLSGEDVTHDLAQDKLRTEGAGIISHMNEDHVSALDAIVSAFCASEKAPENTEMTAVDSSGFLVKSAGDLHYISFGRDIELSEARTVFVKLSQKARAVVEE